MSFWKNTGRFFFGDKGGRENIYNPEQQRTLDYVNQMARDGITNNRGYQQGSDYINRLLSNDPEAYAAFEAPYRQQYEQQVIPGIAERFAGQGAGNTSSSAFRNSLAQAGGDYTTGLAALRAQMQMQALPQALNYAKAPMEQLADLSKVGLNRSPYQEREGSPGFLAQMAGAFGQSAMGPIGQAAGQGLGGIISNWFQSGPRKGHSTSLAHGNTQFDNERY